MNEKEHDMNVSCILPRTLADLHVSELKVGLRVVSNMNRYGTISKVSPFPEERLTCIDIEWDDRSSICGVITQWCAHIKLLEDVIAA